MAKTPVPGSLIVTSSGARLYYRPICCVTGGRAGKTQWDVEWKFKREQQGVTCTMKQTMVTIGIAQTIPKWRGEAKGAAALKVRLQQFAEPLQRHEDGHKEHALKAGREIDATLP